MIKAKTLLAKVIMIKSINLINPITPIPLTWHPRIIVVIQWLPTDCGSREEQ